MPVKTNAYLVQLRDQIAKTFDLGELRELTFDLQLDWDELEGSRKTTRVQDLITQLARNGELEALVELLNKYRPKATWPIVPAPEQQKQDIRTAFPKKSLYQQSLFWAGAIILLAVIGIFLTTWFGGKTTNRINQLPGEIAAAIPTDTPNPTSTPFPTPSPTPLPFLPESENETLIVISTFYHTEGVVDVIPHIEIRDAIEEKLKELDINNVRVEIEPTIIDGTKRDEEKRQDAEALGKLHNASIIIWGVNTGIKVEVNFLLLKEADFDASDVLISEVEATQLVQPDAYGKFILNNLTGQLSFLSLFAIGQSYFVNGELQKAIETIEQALSSISEEPETVDETLQLFAAYFRLGWLYYETGDIYKAMENYSQTIALNNKHVGAFNNRGIIYFDLDDFNSALNDYNQAIIKNPNSKEALLNRSKLFIQLAMFDEALADTEKILEIDPKFAKAYVNRGFIFSNLNEYERAIEDFTKALSLNLDTSNQVIALIDRGNVYIDIGQLENAILDFTQAIEKSPQNGIAYGSRGIAYQRSGKWYDAYLDFTQAISIDPNDATAFGNRGLLFYEVHDYAEALINFNKSIEIEPNNYQNLLNRGSVYYAIGQLENALSDFDKAVSIDPKNSSAYLNRGLAFSSMGQLENALSDLTLYLELEPEAPQRDEIENKIMELENELEK